MSDQTPRRNIGDEENRPYTAGGGYPNEPDQTPRVPDPECQWCNHLADGRACTREPGHDGPHEQESTR